MAPPRGLQTAHRHPLLNPNNGITARFLPGLLLGAVLHWWLSKTQRAPPQVRACSLRRQAASHGSRRSVGGR